MTRRSLTTALSTALVTTLCALPTAASAQTTPTKSGSALYLLYCASCHGDKAKGDGPVAKAMQTKPADLTQIAKKHGGTFPADEVYRSIDGRSAAAGHGGQSMPVWGDAFKRSEGGGQSPDTIKARIDALVRYLETIQAK